MPRKSRKRKPKTFGELLPGEQGSIAMPLVKQSGNVKRGDGEYTTHWGRVPRDEFGAPAPECFGNFGGIGGVPVRGDTPVTDVKPAPMKAEVKGGEVDPVKGES